MSKKNKTSFCAIAVCFWLFALNGCTNSRPDNENQAFQEKFQTFKIDTGDELSITNRIKSAEIIRLESVVDLENKNFFFVDQIEDSLVISRTGRNDIHIFSSDGRLIRSLNQQGFGKGKYDLMHTIWLDEGNIVVYDSSKQLLLFYDLKGKFLHSKPMDYGPSGMYSLGDRLFLDVSRNPIDGKHKRNILVLNYEMEYDRYLIEYEKPKPLSLSYGPNSFHPYKSGLLYQNTLNDTVYLVNASSANPLMSFDFGEQWLWRNDSFKISYSAAKAGIQKQDKVYMFKAIVNDEYVFLKYKLSGEYKSLLIDRASGKQWALKTNEGLLEDTSLKPHFWRNGKLLFSLNAQHADQFIERMKKSEVDVTDETVKGQSKSPILIWVTFKTI